MKTRGFLDFVFGHRRLFTGDWMSLLADQVALDFTAPYLVFFVGGFNSQGLGFHLRGKREAAIQGDRLHQRGRKRRALQGQLPGHFVGQGGELFRFSTARLPTCVSSRDTGLPQILIANRTPAIPRKK